MRAAWPTISAPNTAAARTSSVCAGRAAGNFRSNPPSRSAEGEQFHPREFFVSQITPIRNLLRDIPEIVISEGDKKKLLHGMDLNLITANSESEEFRLMDESGEIIALAKNIQVFTSPVAQPARWVRVHPHITFN